MPPASFSLLCPALVLGFMVLGFMVPGAVLQVVFHQCPNVEMHPPTIVPEKFEYGDTVVVNCSHNCLEDNAIHRQITIQTPTMRMNTQNLDREIWQTNLESSFNIAAVKFEEAGSCSTDNKRYFWVEFSQVNTTQLNNSVVQCKVEYGSSGVCNYLAHNAALLQMSSPPPPPCQPYTTMTDFEEPSHETSIIDSEESSHKTTITDSETTMTASEEHLTTEVEPSSEVTPTFSSEEDPTTSTPPSFSPRENSTSCTPCEPAPACTPQPPIDVGDPGAATGMVTGTSLGTLMLGAVLGALAYALVHALMCRVRSKNRVTGASSRDDGGGTGDTTQVQGYSNRGYESSQQQESSQQRERIFSDSSNTDPQSPTFFENQQSTE